MSEKEFLVTVKCVTERKYLVSADDWERAEDEAIDNVYGESFHVDEMELTVTDVETV